MAKLPEYRTSACEYDGALPYTHSAVLTFTSATQSALGRFVSPCDGTIVAMMANIIAAPATATGKVISVGSPADDDAHYVAYDIATLATGELDLFQAMTVNTATAATVKGKTVGKGDVVQFAIGADGASPTGVVAVTMVIAPNQ